MGNSWHKEKRVSLCNDFGGACQHCSVIEGQWIPPLLEKQVKLEFAHKIGFRFPQGASRGRNTRINEVIKNPERFLLLCKECHVEYDSTPLTEHEQRKTIEYDNERIPF